MKIPTLPVSRSHVNSQIINFLYSCIRSDDADHYSIGLKNSCQIINNDKKFLIRKIKQ